MFLPLWYSGADKGHYKQRDWPARRGFDPGSHNVVPPALVNPQNLLHPPLHIKLGLFENFVKALDEKSFDFNLLKEKFPKVSEAKLNTVTFNNPQIRELLKDSMFDCSMDVNEKKAWQTWKSIVSNFLSAYRSPEYG
ncbi:hypothetical protein FHG87_011980 [Trinorchestia longiramus]|nr:hypothetical protein FHG87_011980 [Trinorchestia longiramus]